MIKLLLAVFYVTKRKPRKLWQMLFVSSKTLFWFLRFSIFCNFRPSNILKFEEEVDYDVMKLA